jgi:predicted short-subunit dehydrogenase-like oxidoreductase (DUF2520 family)
MEGIKSISIIGSGNVAHHLGRAFNEKVKINGVYSPNIENCETLAQKLNCFAARSIAELPVSDLLLLCVKDDIINLVLKDLADSQRVAYTSGAIELSSLSRSDNIGVLYPLQSFSKDKEVDIFHVPFFIEASDNLLAQELFDLAYSVSPNVVFANSEDRKNLHVAAVMVNNFTNHLFHLAQDITARKKLDWKHLLPLINETVSKLDTTPPKEAQTGPARRRDTETINAHLALLDGDTKEIYALLSKSILNTYKTND